MQLMYRSLAISTVLTVISLLVGTTACWCAASANTPIPSNVRTPPTSIFDRSSSLTNEEQRLELAIRFFDPLLANAHTNLERASLLHQRGVLYLRSSSKDKAVTDFNEALRLLPKNNDERLDLLFHRACALLLLPNPDAEAAITDITVCLATQPNDAEALIIRADAYHKLGKDALAKADLAQATRIAPKGDATIRALLENAQATLNPL